MGLAQRAPGARGLSLSLYSRLVGEGLQPQFLDTQFRAHPLLLDFSDDKATLPGGSYEVESVATETPASDALASRFLLQASFGPTEATVAWL